MERLRKAAEWVAQVPANQTAFAGITMIEQIEQVTRRDFLKLGGLLTLGSALNKACRTLGVDPNDSIQVSTPNSEIILPNFYDASPESNLFLTEQIFGRLEKIVDLDAGDNQRYVPQIEIALKKQWGVSSSDLEAVVVDGFKIVDHTGLSEVHYPIVWIENPEIITSKMGEPLPAASLFVGFNPDLLYFVPPNELKGDKLMGKLFPLVFTNTDTNAFAGLGKYRGTKNEYDMAIPIFNYSLKDKTLKIYDPYTAQEMELNVEENPVDIQKPKDVLASLVPVSAVFEGLENTFTSSPVYNLNRLGEITMDIGDGGTKIIPDIQVQPDGTMTFTYEGQTYSADTQTLVIDGQTITFKDIEGGIWVFDGEKLSEYLSSADGTVLWTKEGMANGELRVKDEKAKELINDTLKALWAVNNALVNPAYINDTPQEIIDDRKAFLEKFPTANALIKYVEDGGEPVDFIYIPVNNSQALSARHLPTAMIQKIENIDLSKIIIGFDILPKSELVGITSFDTYIPMAINSPYVEFGGLPERLLVEAVKLSDSQAILSWKFNSIFDYEIHADKALGRITLYQEQLPSDKLLGATVLAKTGLDLTASLLPKHTEINKAITPPVLLSYYNLRYIYKDKITDERYYQNASNLTKSYFELQ